MVTENKTEKQRANVVFAATDRYIEENIVSPKETKTPTRNWVEWGTKNAYPDYLLDLYNNVPTLRSIVNGNIDYVAGDDVTILPLASHEDGVVNSKGTTIREQVRDIAKDFEIYGGFALQVIRSITGEICDIYHVDMRYLRTNPDCNVFYYSERWQEFGRKNVIVYPAFMPNLDWGKLTDEERKRNASSILFVKNVNTQTYPSPLYSASVKACEIERMIDKFHINAIANQFCSSAIINFNNGIPEDEQKEEIEEAFNEKFCGAENSGRVMFSWNKNRESQTTIQEFKIEDFGERYKALSDHSRQQIFTAFRANPNLFGIPTENLGFNSEEYESAFKLYNRTQIRPVQRTICDAYDKIYGAKGVLTIKPFSIDGDETKVN